MFLKTHDYNPCEAQKSFKSWTKDLEGTWNPCRNEIRQLVEDECHAEDGDDPWEKTAKRCVLEPRGWKGTWLPRTPAVETASLCKGGLRMDPIRHGLVEIVLRAVPEKSTK